MGPMPDKLLCMPDSSPVKSRDAFNTWHYAQVARGEAFSFQKELSAYHQSDEKLLKEGCLEFKSHFKGLVTVI